MLFRSKPQTRAFGGEVKIKVKKGDESINYVKMSYSDAKKFIKELENEEEDEAEDAADAGAEAEADADASETEGE